MAKNKDRNKKVIEVSFRKAFSVFLGTVIAGLTGGIFAGLSLINTDHFTIVTLDRRVAAIEEDIIPRTEFILQMESLGEKIDRHFENSDKRLDRIDDRINDMNVSN